MGYACVQSKTTQCKLGRLTLQDQSGHWELVRKDDIDIESGVLVLFIALPDLVRQQLQQP